MRKLLFVLVAPLVLLVGGMWAVVPLMFMNTSGGDDDPAAECVGQKVGGESNLKATEVLSKQQVELAGTIYQVARESGFGAHTDQAAVVAIMTAMQESTLGADPATHKLNGDDDAGPFQIRVRISWHAETLAQAMDPVYSAKVFFLGKTVTEDEARRALADQVKEPLRAGYTIPGLKQIPDWTTMAPGDAAQRVQVSAFPTAYAKHEPLARSLVATLSEANLGPILCGGSAEVLSDCPPTGLGVEQGLTPDALRILRCAKQKWPQLTSFSGVREDSLPHHPSGRGLDLMLPGWDTPQGKQVGKDIAAWLHDSATSLGVDHIIFDRQIWSQGRQKEGWRSCAQGSCYNGPDPTQAHEDHVHVTVFGDRGAPGAKGSGKTHLPLASYTLTARFGQCSQLWANCHTGLDFAAPAGTPIKAVQDGKVTSVGWGGAYGNLVKINHGGVEAYYAHQSRTGVVNGQQVKAGQVIGWVGETGNTRGAHLHLEIRQGGVPTDPFTWLKAKGLNP